MTVYAADDTCFEMNWDVAFILRDYPAHYRFSDSSHFMLPVSPAMIDGLLKLDDLYPVAPFFRECGVDRFTTACFRVDAADENAAVDSARHRLAGFLDGISLIVGHEFPRICPLAYIRREGEEDARIVGLPEPTWAYFRADDGEAERLWRSRSDSVFRVLLRFFDLVIAPATHASSSLSRQLLYSTKMYRHGMTIEIYGLEFICKCSALEGLVCGGEREKRKLLRERLPNLYHADRAETEELVDKIWTIRNEAVHEARAFRSGTLTDSPILSEALEGVDRLFLGTFVFATENLETASSVRELWPKAQTYQLPGFVTMKRPPSMPRFMMTSCTLETHQRWLGGSRQIDQIFEAQK